MHSDGRVVLQLKESRVPRKASREQAASAAPYRGRKGFSSLGLSLVPTHLPACVLGQACTCHPSPPSQAAHSVSEVGQPGGG